MSARKPRLVRSKSPRQQEADVRRPSDFCDPESVRVLDAIADALIAPAIRQKAREDFAGWLASQQVRR
ncbi:MAG: hypothetical protein ACRD3G_21295 [Vicinamibacterales bacterium]